MLISLRGSEVGPWGVACLRNVAQFTPSHLSPFLSIIRHSQYCHVYFNMLFECNGVCRKKGELQSALSWQSLRATLSPATMLPASSRLFLS